MGLYFKIEATNTIDIVDGLFQAKIFTKETADLIKEALSFTYQMRIRTHDFYREQRDDLCIDANAAMNCRMLSLEEKEQLEKIYWLVLRPLYQSLGKGLSLSQEITSK
ncbi:MAG: hypothetical protein LVR00_04795, partial [Rhabdochlamydiaceae bacterium]